MSLARTALRLQVIEALLADPLIDALVEGRVYDSRIGAIDHREPMPVILVTTDTTKGKGWSANNGGNPFRTVCNLTLEIAQTAVSEDGETVGIPATDRELEAQLDLLEWRALDVLTVGDSPQAALLRKVTTRVSEFTSDRFPTDQTGEKLAIRYVVLEVELKGEIGGDATRPATGPYASLPEPLRTVALAAPVGSSARAVCDALAAQVPLIPDDPFRGVDAVIAPQALDPASPPDPDADVAAGRTAGVAVSLPVWSP